MTHALLQPVIVAALAAALTGCLFQDKVESFGGPTMGSTYSVKYVADDAAVSKEQLRDETEAILAKIDSQMSTYRADSDIETFNALPPGACMAMPGEVLELFRAGQQLSKESAGAFDLTVEPLLDLLSASSSLDSVAILKIKSLISLSSQSVCFIKTPAMAVQ